MIRNVVIMQQSGLVLFSKEFINSIAQPRLVGSLLTAIIEFGQQTTGMGVCFIELSNFAITIVTNDAAKIFCVLFYDREDGVIFGRLICSEILNAFTQEYSSDLTQFGRNLKDFHGFHSKINNVVRLSAKPILLRLEAQVGIRKVLLINNKVVIDTPNSRIDHMSVLSNLTYLMDLCTEICKCITFCIRLYIQMRLQTLFLVESADDSLQHLSINSSDDNAILLWKIQEKTVFIVIVDKSVCRDEYVPHIEEALEIVEQGKLSYNNFDEFELIRLFKINSVRLIQQPDRI